MGFNGRIQNSRGITLFEMLVVLVIVSLVGGLLMQALWQVLDVRGRTLSQIHYQERGLQSERWFRDAVNSLVAEVDRIEEGVFRGDRDGFSGTSLASLDEPYGVPARISWRIQGDDGAYSLIMSGKEENYELMRLRDGPAGFRYLDEEGAWHEEWPSSDFGTPDAQLPRAISFRGEGPRKPVFWLARIPADADPRPSLDPQDLTRPGSF